MSTKGTPVKIRETIEREGYKASTVSIEHLQEVQAAVSRLVGQGLVNRRLSENWNFYLENDAGLTEAQTIVIIAIPQSIVKIIFRWHGNDYPAEVAPGYFYHADEIRVEGLLKNALVDNGCKIVKANLALKTLAVRSGLAEYGRNNIAYVPGMGSFLRLVAYYTDFLCEEDNWGSYQAMSDCTDCTICRNNCPTGCFDAERFLIHAENCLGFLGQRQPDFPYWVRLQPDWKNALVGCMRCQFDCPVNEPFIGNIREGPSFSEEETGQILEAVQLDQLSPETRRKLSDMPDRIYPLFSRNLRELVDRN
jgi:epoxyqueuosine reductase